MGRNPHGHSRESEYFARFSLVPVSLHFTEPQSTVLAFPRKEGDGNRNDSRGIPPSGGRRVLFLITKIQKRYMKSKASWMLASASVAIGICLANASAATVTFEGLLSGANTYNNNAGAGNAFVIGDASFSNQYNATFGSWSGFAISNTTDTTTPGYLNQYSAITGSGAGGSSTYAVSYDATSVTFATTLDLNGLGSSITNTTYSALSILNGDSIAKKFGGVSGDDPDFFKLTIRGFSGGTATGTLVDFYLADFRFADNSQDYVINQWTSVDFSPLGMVDELRFEYTSSDVGRFGINTPTYFALDNFLAVPEPSAALLSILGSLGLLGRCRGERGIQSISRPFRA
jgi:Domain of unknown function (DUF4465)